MIESPFVLAAGLVFLAELGDKTQLIALAMATRYRMRTVLLGAGIGTVLVTGLSVAIGATLGRLLAEHWLKIGTGLLLIVFALLILRGEEGGEEDVAGGGMARFGPVAGIATIFFVAELGDKTMLATASIAAQSSAYVQVWLGASAGMVAANVIGIAIGRFAGARLPERTIRWVAATIFLLSGVWILLSGIAALR